MADVKRDEGLDIIAIVWRVCMFCKVVLGTRPAVPPSEEAGDITHGLCKDPVCLKAFMGK